MRDSARKSKKNYDINCERGQGRQRGPLHALLLDTCRVMTFQRPIMRNSRCLGRISVAALTASLILFLNPKHRRDLPQQSSTVRPVEEARNTYLGMKPYDNSRGWVEQA